MLVVNSVLIIYYNHYNNFLDIEYLSLDTYLDIIEVIII